MMANDPRRRAVSFNPARQARDEAARGDVLYLDSQFGAALARYREAVRLRPANAQYRLRLAGAAWRAGETRDVEAHLLEAIRLDPELAAAHESMATWSAKHGNIPAALEYSAAALALSPGDCGIILTRADVLIDDGQTNAAWELVEPLVASGDCSERLAATYARLAPGIGHAAQALAMLERMLGQRGRSPLFAASLHFLAAGLLDGMGRYDEAFAQANASNGLKRRSFVSAG